MSQRIIRILSFWILICLPVSAQGVKDLNGRAMIEYLAALQPAGKQK